jgi:hypothetical protein
MVRASFRTGGVVYALNFAGDTALACGRISSAAAYYTEAATRAAAASQAHPVDARARIDLSRAEHGLARCFAARHETEKAREHNALAAAALKPLLDTHPDNPYARRLLAEANGR